MKGQSPQCYIPSFIKIGPPIPEKLMLKGFYHIYGQGDHLGHVTWTIYVNFGSPFLRIPHVKFGFDW